MPELLWKAILDDGSEILWGDRIVVDGVEKEASIDDIDRSKLSNLLTMKNGEVVHALGFGKHERDRKLAVWRSYWEQTATSPLTRRGALVGYNELKKDGTTELKLDFVTNEGEVLDGAGFEVALHEREVFSEVEAEIIRENKALEQAKTEEDNTLLESLKKEHGNDL